jgi:NAD(P)-dependent dehydrogenase (short-subunit alcohol dehydrogenase family)
MSAGVGGDDSRALAGKVAIVTGAGTRGVGVGIGKAIAITLARLGARVALIDREPSRADETEKMIAAEGGTSCVIAADVTQEGDCRRAVAATYELYGSLDILVNNAAISDTGVSIGDTDRTDWDRVISVNLTGAMCMSQAALESFAAGSGAMVNIASVSAMNATGALAYGASKAGMVSLTQNLAVSLGARGIRVNAIAPGFILTPMVLDEVPGHARDLSQRLVPLASEGSPWDIADAVAFLVSDRARFISGVCLPVDGGSSAASVLYTPYLLSRAPDA